MQCKWFARLVISALAFPLPLFGQANITPSACPVEILKFNPAGISGFSIRLQNLSAKEIVGMTFNIALSDATEHWKWFHYDFDPLRPLVSYNWNKAVKPGAAKTLNWGSREFDFEHGGGGAFVLTSVLYEDGYSWEELPNRASCQALWFDYHKKGLTKPVILPIRQ